MGLTRNTNVPNGTVLVLSGFAAGAIVGAGATFLFYSEQGKDVRRKIGEYFAGSDESTASEGETAQGTRQRRARRGQTRRAAHLSALPDGAAPPSLARAVFSCQKAPRWRTTSSR